MLRSVLAVLSGFLAVAVLSLGTDQVLHMLNVYPPWGEPMWSPWLNLLALGYRTVYTVFGGYLTISVADLGPAWYPVLLAVLSFPSVWIGGVWQQRGRSVPRTFRTPRAASR